MKLKALPRFELSSLVALQDAEGAWMVVGAARPSEEAAELALEIGAALDTEVEVINIDEATGIAELSEQSAERPVVFLALGSANALPLDEQRSKLRRKRSATLVMSLDAATNLASRAPHFTSWIGSEIRFVEEDRFLETEAKDARLDALRAKHAMSDATLLARAAAGELDADPDLAEWLVLLDRGDLLEASR